MQDHITFFGRRKGKRIRAARTELLKTLLPQIAINIPSDKKKIEFENIFPFSPKEVWLEVGFGGGEHLAEQARRNPHVGFIGAEVFVNGVASLLAHLTGTHNDGTIKDSSAAPVITTDRVDNIRIFNDDVRQLFPFFPDACLDRIFVLFPDPWPKKRHAERRFIGPANLPVLARLLKKGGELRVASDDMNYIRWALQHLNNSASFTWTARTSADWNTPPSDWVPTRYEAKALVAGRKPVYLVFKKV